MPRFLFTDGETEVKSLGRGLCTHTMVSGLPAGVCPFSPLSPCSGVASKLGCSLIYAPLCQAHAWAARRGAKWDTAQAGRSKEKGENSSSDGLALVGGANISDSQVFPVLSPQGGQRPWAGSRDFLRPWRVGEVRSTQGSPFLCLSHTCSSFARKEEVTG